MSLRTFHLLFVALSVILTAFFAAWRPASTRGASARIRRRGGRVARRGAGLAVYGAAFQRKTRQMR